MGEKVTLVIDEETKETVTLDWPLVYREPPESLRPKLGLNSFVDLTDPVVARGLELIHCLRGLPTPISAAYFGGLAFRLRFPSANDPHLGLRHPLHDIDLAIQLRDAAYLRTALPRLGERAGSALTTLETRADFRLNTLLGGQRFRFHMVNPLEGGRVGLALLDVVADQFRFCHSFDLTEDLGHAKNSGAALSPTLLFLTKMQFIQRVPRDTMGPMEGRVIGSFGKDEVLIGAESKDVRDVLSLLLDAADGDGYDALSLRRVVQLLERDWGAWNTVRLNVAMLRASPELRALPEGLRGVLEQRIAELSDRLAGIVPRRGRPRFRREWWETVDTADDRGAAAN